MTAQATLILVHGVFHRAEAWEPLIKALPDIDVRAVQLPSSAPVPPAELGDLNDDARAVREAVLAVEGPVVVCAHSYGGIPVSEGLAQVDSVRRIVYLNSLLLDVGESMLDHRSGAYSPYWEVHEDENYVVMTDAEHVFYNDLDPAVAREAAAKLGPQALAPLSQPLTQAAWHTVAHLYVIGERDNCLPSAVREKFAGRAQEVVRMDTSHSPFLSRPRETAELLREELNKAVS